MKIMTFNCNGIRSAARKGFFEWLPEHSPDVLCLQETKAQQEQLEPHPEFFPEGYHCYYFDAERKGYAGTAIFARREPDRVLRGIGWSQADCEGRYIQADFGNLSVASLYMPSGSSGEERQAIKMEFLDRFLPQLEAMRRDGREYIICADWNICHKTIDIRNWKANQKNSGFLPEERQWLDRVYDEVGFVDAFRLVNQEADQYSWWSMRGRAREKNVGWRLDYQVITPGLVPLVREAEIHSRNFFSDHAPVSLDYAMNLRGSLGRSRAQA